jgi:hypothetical protein
VRVVALATVAALGIARAARGQEPPAPAEPPPPAQPQVVVTPPPTPEEQAQAAKEAAAPEETKPATRPRAGFVKGEGFRVLSEDGQWKLRVGLQAATSYEPTFLPGSSDWNEFRVAFARLRVDGSLYKKWLRYWFTFEFNNFPPFLLDGYIEVQPWAALGIRLGQMFTPISRHEYLGPQEILFPEWALVADYFWPGRDKGVELFGETDYVLWYFGFYAGSGLRTAVTIPGNFQLMGRITLNPMGPMGWGEIPYVMAEGPVPARLSFSLQGYWSRITPQSTGFNPSDGFYQRTDGPEQRQGAFAADVAFQWGRFGFLCELYARDIAATMAPTAPFWQLGWWAQANVTFYARILDFAVRASWLNPDSALPNDEFASFEAQLAWFIKAPYLSLKLRYAYAHQQDPGPAPASDPMLFSLVQQPLSTPGNGHLLTLQAMVYF